MYFLKILLENIQLLKERKNYSDFKRKTKPLKIT